MFVLLSTLGQSEKVFNESQRQTRNETARRSGRSDAVVNAALKCRQSYYTPELRWAVKSTRNTTETEVNTGLGEEVACYKTYVQLESEDHAKQVEQRDAFILLYKKTFRTPPPHVAAVKPPRLPISKIKQRPFRGIRPTGLAIACAPSRRLRLTR